MAEKARYRATERVYANGIIIDADNGEASEFVSDHVPGEAWEPLNDAAEEAIAARDEARAKRPAAAFAAPDRFARDQRTAAISVDDAIRIRNAEDAQLAAEAEAETLRARVAELEAAAAGGAKK